MNLLHLQHSTENRLPEAMTLASQACKHVVSNLQLQCISPCRCAGVGAGSARKWGIKTRHIASACIVLWHVLVLQAPVLAICSYIHLWLCQHNLRINYVSTMSSEVNTEYDFIDAGHEQTASGDAGQAH